jgi:hypothetical protein
VAFAVERKYPESRSRPSRRNLRPPVATANGSSRAARQPRMTLTAPEDSLRGPHQRRRQPDSCAASRRAGWRATSTPPDRGRSTCANVSRYDASYCTELCAHVAKTPASHVFNSLRMGSPTIFRSRSGSLGGGARDNLLEIVIIPSVVPDPDRRPIDQRVIDRFVHVIRKGVSTGQLRSTNKLTDVDSRRNFSCTSTLPPLVRSATTQMVENLALLHGSTLREMPCRDASDTSHGRHRPLMAQLV